MKILLIYIFKYIVGICFQNLVESFAHVTFSLKYLINFKFNHNFFVRYNKFETIDWVSNEVRPTDFNFLLQKIVIERLKWGWTWRDFYYFCNISQNFLRTINRYTDRSDISTNVCYERLHIWCYDLQKLAARCERKMCAARLAIAAAEEREQAVRKHLPLAVSDFS